MAAVTKLTKHKAFLLSLLAAGGGSLRGRQIDHGYRSLASRMQSDDLVQWERTDPRAYKNLDEWTLHITDKGREALRSQPT